MIGDEYFQLRAQIGTSLFSLAKLARELVAPEPLITRLVGLQAGLREPFVFLMLGESGAGKSCLLNALFDREFAGGEPFRGRAAIFRYGAAAADTPRGEGIIESERPFIFLRDFTLVDGAAVGSINTSTEVLTRFLPTADLIFFTLALRSEGAAWDFLAGLPRVHLRRLVLIVSKCDTAAQHEVLLGVKRLRHTMLARLGQACPIFAVAAPTRLGFDKLERHIDTEVLTSAPRCEKLRQVCATAQEILAELGEPIRIARRKAERNAARIEEHRQVLVGRKEQSLRHAGGTLWSLTQTFEAARNRGDNLLRGKLTLVGLYEKEREWWVAFNEDIEERLRHDVLRHLESSFERFADDLCEAWEAQGENLQRLGGPSIGPFCREHTALRVALQTTVRERDPKGVTTHHMANALENARDLLKLPGHAALGALAVFAGAWIAGTFVEGAAIVLMLTAAGVLLLLQALRGNAFAQFHAIMTHRRETLLSFFEEVMREETDAVYHDLTVAFEPLIEVHANERLQFEPALQRLEQLSELFIKCCADIAARKASAPPPPEEYEIDAAEPVLATP